MGRTHRTVVVFGGAGFIGSNLVHHLLTETDVRVRVFDNLARAGVKHNLKWLERAAERGRLEIIVGNVCDAEKVARAVQDATEVYHFAAQVAVTTSLQNPREDFETNLLGTFNVLEGIRAAGNKPFLLFTSTNKVYGNMPDREVELAAERYAYANGITGIGEDQPLDFHSPYGCSKGAADQYVRDYARIFQIPAVVFRMSCIAGKRQFGNEDQGWVAHFLYRALADGELTIYGDGRQVRDVLYVDDLIRAFEAVRHHKSLTAGQIYNVGGGPSNTVSLLELIAKIEALTKRKVRYTFSAARPGDQTIYVSDVSKIQRDAAWSPNTTVDQTLAHIYDFWSKNRRAVQEIAAENVQPIAPSNLIESPAFVLGRTA